MTAHVVALAIRDLTAASGAAEIAIAVERVSAALEALGPPDDAVRRELTATASAAARAAEHRAQLDRAGGRAALRAGASERILGTAPAGSPDHGLDAVTSQLATMIGDVAAVRLVDPYDGRCHFVTAHGRDRDAQRRIRTRLDRTLGEPIDGVGEPTRARPRRRCWPASEVHAAKDAIGPVLAPLVDELGPAAVLSVALQTRQAVLGSLICLRLGDDATYSDDECEFVATLAEQMAAALDAARLLALATREIEDRRLAEAALARAARRDHLTGLPNRAVFLERLDAALSRSPSEGADVAVLFLDLDRFKIVNDALGHAVGDVLLIDAAARLRAVVGVDDVVARFGGDEFTVLREGVTTPVELTAFADEIIAAFGEPFEVAGGEFFITASIGIAAGGSDIAVDASSLLRDADTAMYRAKEHGRSRYEVFDAAMRRQVVQRVQVEADLRRALENTGEIVVHLQPIVDLPACTVAGYEALARWAHPTRGLLGPCEFVPLAEETGLIVPLGEMVLHLALGELSRAAGPGRPSVVTVNVSPRQLVDPNLAAIVEDALGTHRLEPWQLGLEITETAILEDLDVARDVVDDLASIGVRILIDDFGTGYSSIARLRSLPFHAIKVDRDFVAPIAVDGSARQVVGAVIDLAHGLGLRVVAEGVEDRSTLGVLRELGCDSAQGYLFSPPLPPAQAFALAPSSATRLP